MKIEIPGYPSLDLKYLLLDYNGTIALDGIISEAVANKIRQLSDLFQIYVLTADTNGTARQMCEGLPVEILTSQTTPPCRKSRISSIPLARRTAPPSATGATIFSCAGRPPSPSLSLVRRACTEDL